MKLNKRLNYFELLVHSSKTNQHYQKHQKQNAMKIMVDMPQKVEYVFRVFKESINNSSYLLSIGLI